VALPGQRLALAAALALVATSAGAQTSHEGRYQVLDLDGEFVSYVDEATMGREGASRDAWMLRITRSPVTVAGYTFRVSKSMFIVDCDKMTLHNEAIVFWTADGGSHRVDLGARGDTAKVKPGSTGATVADFVCKGTVNPKLKELPPVDEAKAVAVATSFFDNGKK
jgi:hypothetical protein